MAYACPVCGEPQVDAVHLADHLAFTAIAGDDEHEAWLDETAGEWGDRSREDLAEIVVDHAEETDFPIDVDDEELGLAEHDSHAHDHAPGGGVHGHAHGEGRQQRGPPAADTPSADDEDVADVLDEAREYTRRMQGDDATTSDGADSDSAGDGGESTDDATGDDGGTTDDGASDNETE